MSSSINKDNIIRQLPDNFSNLLTNMTDKSLLKNLITKINADPIKQLNLVFSYIIFN